MRQLSAVFWIGLVFATGFTTYIVKYAVQSTEDQLARIHRQTVAEQQQIRVLNAEWTYLTQPQRLADLNQQFLHLVPITPKQLQQKIEDIPLRPPPIPDIAVAAATPPALAQSPAPVAAQPPAIATPQPPAMAAAQPAEPATTPALTPVAAQTPATKLPLTIAALSREAALEPLPVRVATADAPPAPTSLDALIAQIEEKR